MKYRKIFALLLAAATLFSLAACGEAAAGPEATPEPATDDGAATVSGQTLTFGDAADSVFSLSLDYEESLNPVKTQSTLNQLVDCLVYDRLFEVDENFNVTSRVLSDWYYSKNEDSAGVWVLRVKDGIQMHDGSTLTAQDVAYSVSCIFTSEKHKNLQMQIGRVYSSAFNGEVYLATEGADNAQLPQRMSIPIIKAGSVGDEIPVGSGPYMYNEDRTALVKFDGYENSESLPLDEVQLRAYRGMEELITEFESGLVDLVVNDPTGIYNMGYGGKNEKRVITTTNLHFIGFNSKSRFFQYDAYRCAMNWIVNRDKIVSDTLDGNAVATVLPIHPNSSLYDTDIASQFSYDPARCLTELERGGCRDLDADGMLEFALSGMKVDIELNFAVCADNAAKVQEARQIAEDMEAIGLSVNLRELTWKDYLAALRTGYIDADQEEPEIPMDMYLAEVALTGDWNILTLISGDWEEDNTLNYGGWENSELERLTEAYLGAKDDDRAQAVRDWLQLLTTTTVILPVCFETRDVISHLGTIFSRSPKRRDGYESRSAWSAHHDRTTCGRKGANAYDRSGTDGHGEKGCRIRLCAVLEIPRGRGARVQRRHGIHRLQRGERRLRRHDLRRAHRGGESREQRPPRLCPHRHLGEQQRILLSLRLVPPVSAGVFQTHDRALRQGRRELREPQALGNDAVFLRLLTASKKNTAEDQI